MVLVQVVRLTSIQQIPQLLNMAVLSALKITCLMSKIFARCFVARIGNTRYLVKFGKIDEFVCLMLPKVVVIESMITAPVTWEHEFQWYKPI